MLDLYYWPTPNGWKITIFLEEAGVPYNVVPLNIAKGEQFSEEFLKINPNHRMPAIVDPDGPDGKPLSIFESAAILLYLAEKHGKFLSKDTRKKYDAIQWLEWQMGGVSMDEKDCRSLSSGALFGPGLAAVTRVHDGAHVADRPAVLFVQQEEAVEGEPMTCFRERPGLSMIVAGQRR